MPTFSELVDICQEEVGHGGSLSLTASYLNSRRKMAMPKNHFSSHVYWKWDPSDLEYQGHIHSKTQLTLPLPSDYMNIVSITTERSETLERVEVGHDMLNSPKGSFYTVTGNRLILVLNPVQPLMIIYVKRLKVMSYVKPDNRLLRSRGEAYEYRPALDAPWVPYDPNNAKHLSTYNSHVDFLLDNYPYILIPGVLSSISTGRGDTTTGARQFQEFNQGVKEIYADSAPNYGGQPVVKTS